MYYVINEDHKKKESFDFVGNHISIMYVWWLKLRPGNKNYKQSMNLKLEKAARTERELWYILRKFVNHTI